jgi:BCL2-associated athanogene 2
MLKYWYGVSSILLFQVNTLIDGIVLALQQDPTATRCRCLSYMSACSARDEHETLVAMVTGLQPVRTDKGFESALLGCTLDDQKNVKRRLRGLLEYISNVHPL